jgi:hypothetical protein
MQEFPDFVPAFSHHLKPAVSDGSQFTGMLLHPRVDGRIALDGAVESQKIPFHRRSTFCSGNCQNSQPTVPIGVGNGYAGSLVPRIWAAKVAQRERMLS